ncbi:hypothetical protein [Klebsiella pneumoniae]|uniref:hypothetical protein n=1 Tax=Klebsiella pneumoniae TaxID=573 RepID=UPI0009B98683|nr:hypothetical protein [Klebsiella pneumoniae]SLS82994.1 SilE [Klebsiella pneumoniae]
MKNIVLASLLGFGLISSAWATETVNIHDRVNNAQAPAHQMQSAEAPVGIERAAVAHEFMNNGQSGPHQAMAEAHRRMINAG